MTAGYAMRILFLSAVLAAGTTAVAAVTKHDASAIAPLEAGALRALPLAFEQNVGQSHARVHFVARGAGFEAFLTNEGANVVLTDRDGEAGSVIQIGPSKGRPHRVPTAEDPLIGTANYFSDVDPSDGVID